MMKSKFRYIFAFVFVLVMSFACVGLVACGKNNDPKIDFENSNVLVTYFSATGSTERVAGDIQEVLSADIWEIVPETPYSSSDLNWNNSSSRVNAEHNARLENDTSSPYFRPQFVKSLDNIEQYDVIFVGYPIWWQEAPNIVYTFLEEYSEVLEGKTIIPFCTSSSSGLGASATNLHDAVDSSVTWLTGRRFSSGASKSTVNAWIKQMSV